MNWSTLEINRSTFLAVLCPTSTTEPKVLPCWSKTLYSLVNSTSLAFSSTERALSAKSIATSSSAAIYLPSRA